MNYNIYKQVLISSEFLTYTFMCRYSLIPICDAAKKYLLQKKKFKNMHRLLVKLLSIIKAIASICFIIENTQYVYKSVCLKIRVYQI